MSDNGIKWCSIAVAVSAYTIEDMSHGHLLTPTRALVNDIAVTKDEIESGNSKYALYQAIGRSFAYILVSINWPNVFSNISQNNNDVFLSNIISFFGIANDQITACFTLSIIPIWIVITFILCLTPSQTPRLHIKTTTTTSDTNASTSTLLKTIAVAATTTSTNTGATSHVLTPATPATPVTPKIPLRFNFSLESRDNV